jgi:hypothetical protein
MNVAGYRGLSEFLPVGDGEMIFENGHLPERQLAVFQGVLVSCGRSSPVDHNRGFVTAKKAEGPHRGRDAHC